MSAFRSTGFAWSLGPWCLGLGLLIVLARAQGAYALAVGGSGAATVLFLAGLLKSRTLLLDLALLLLVAAVAAPTLTVTETSQLALFLSALLLGGLAHTLARHVLRSSGQQANAPIGAIALKAALRLGPAGVLAFVAVKGLEWNGSLVSARWADSLDRSSTAMLVTLGAVLLAVGTATTVSRVAIRRRQAMKDQLAVPQHPLDSAPDPT